MGKKRVKSITIFSHTKKIIDNNINIKTHFIYIEQKAEKTLTKKKM